MPGNAGRVDDDPARQVPGNNGVVGLTGSTLVTQSPQRVDHIGLFGVTLTLAAYAGVLLGNDGPAAALLVAFACHAIASFYRGVFDRPRRFMFTALALLILATEVWQFASYIVPWGQVAFFLATIMPRMLAPLLHVQGLGFIVAVIGFALLLADICLVLRGRPLAMLIALIAGVAIAGVAWLSPFAAFGRPPQSSPLQLLPHWSILPVWAIMLAVPSKLGGIVAAFIAVASPLIVPWVSGERLRASSIWPFWAGNVCFIALGVLALGWFGGSGPDMPYHVVRVLAVMLFCCVWVVPFALRSHMLRRLRGP
jgi:quinol-cytochrome oxidoreductase complex cytochrome b subunit